MQTHPKCTYWYQITILVDTESDGHRKTATIRIPVICISPGEESSICTFVDPSSAKVVSKNIPNDELFDSALGPEMKNQPIKIHNPEPKFIPMQVCPLCVGEGRITSKSTSAMFQECPLCKGQRAIPMAKA